ncbi:MAG: 4-hydroxythreonine-4-phosphate dehydrogenase PdxA [Chloroflexi bacterium]|jgi:4-hydroxythreonine-4-phosphate dehydrogenase|nr:4-hydroxythreonine-4-phosphate dehydrogenase PdxA [Chloroflexota bacterium]
MTTKPLLGITMGDPNGIGPEIIAKLLGDTAFKPKARALVIGDAGCIERSLQKLRIQRAVRRLASAVELPPEEPECIDVLDLKNVDEHAQRMGTVQPAAGHAAHEALIMAADLALAGQIDAIVTAPLNKEALHLAGIQEPGHTEILAARAGVRNVTMMLVAGAFRVTHVSTHCSLREAIERVQVARIQTVIELTHCTVHQLGIARPRLAVAGLNPHAGEGGLFGDEERLEIQPAIDAARAAGIDVAQRPQPPDTVFHQMHAQGRYDAVVAMYHDQGHIPTKLLAFDEGVNVTLGLPIIRTSVDHGTAYDIVGQGVANPSSLRQAFELAATMARSKSAGQ